MNGQFYSYIEHALIFSGCRLNPTVDFHKSQSRSKAVSSSRIDGALCWHPLWPLLCLQVQVSFFTTALGPFWPWSSSHSKSSLWSSWSAATTQMADVGPRGGFHKLNYSDRRHFWLNVICPNLASDRPFRHISHESGNSRNLIRREKKCGSWTLGTMW